MTEYALLLAKLKNYRMDMWERRAQAISWVAGQVLCDRPDEDEWLIRQYAAEAWRPRQRQCEIVAALGPGRWR